MKKLQMRLEFKNSLRYVTYWKPTGDEEKPYKFVTGSVFNSQNKLIRKKRATHVPV